MPDYYQQRLPPIQYPDGRKAYAIAVFHQMHCLVSFRSAQRLYWHWLPLQFAIMQRYHVLLTSNQTGETLSLDDAQHMEHCFDYLRQSIQCAGDVTIESKAIGSEELDRTGGVHMCRKIDDIFAWAEQNKPWTHTDNAHRRTQRINMFMQPLATPKVETWFHNWYTNQSRGFRAAQQRDRVEPCTPDNLYITTL